MTAMTDNGNENTGGKKNDGIGTVLFVIYLFFLLAAVIIIGRIIYIQVFYKPDEAFIREFTPQNRKEIIEPERGAILTADGKILAASVPMYQIAIDCTVRKAEFLKMKNREKGEEAEAEWLQKAKDLSKGLSAIYKDKSAGEYYRMIAEGRRSNRRYVRIGGLVNHEQMLEISSLPLFEEGKYKGGIIIEKYEKRIYPYGSLAKRILGNLDDNNPNNDDVGIEGKYDYALHGTEGYEWLKKTDNYEYIRNYDSTFVKVEDGKDVRTTLNIEIQDIAEKALKKGLEGNEKIVDKIEGGCAIVMDVKTGAIRAMVNLTMDKDKKARERFNYAVGRAEAPGSVFKTATLMALLDDGKAELSTEVPTFRGIWSYKGEKMPADPYLRRWESDKISVRDGMKISSNQVFRYLVCENYDDAPERFVNKLYEYKLGEAFDFDVKGLATPEIPLPGSVNWSGTTLPTIAYGYSIKETPLHIAMFYNGIANRGKLMKPYLVESIEKDGKVVERIKPTVLNGSICSEATIDSITDVLKDVVLEGTAKRVKSAKCPVAGKTGTARMLVTYEHNGKQFTAYQDDKGQKRHQGSFVGFFPADEPRYTVMVVVYSKLSTADFYGGSIPADVFREIVNSIYTLSGGWSEKLKSKGSVPDMAITKIETGADELDKVPDIKGMGLKDAMYSVENCGYKCSYEGTGHVVRQSPAAGTSAKKGTTVHFTLK